MRLTPPEWFRSFSLLALAALYFSASVPLWGWGLFLILGLIALFCFKVGNRTMAVLLCVISLLGGLSHWRTTSKPNDALVHLHEQSATLTGYISGFPDERRTGVQARATITQMCTIGGTCTDTHATTLMKVPVGLSLAYGQGFTASGGVRLPQPFDGFDYPAYLMRSGIRTLFTVKTTDEITLLADAPTQSLAPLRWASNLRTTGETAIRSALPEPHATIALGVLIGIKSPLPRWTEDTFRASGLQHLLVVSGFNVTVLVIAIGWALSFLAPRFRWLVLLPCLILYVLVTGADAPILRAGLMGAIVGWATITGRFADGRNALLLSLLAIGFLNPYMIQADVGLHLSAMATFGMILFTPVLQCFFAWIPWLPLRQIVAVSFTAQLSVFPLLALTFTDVPLAGFIANIFAEPLVPFSMAGGGLAMLGGLVGGAAESILAVPANVFIEALLQLAHVFGQGGGLTVPRWISLVLLFFMILAMAYATLSRRYAERYFVRKTPVASDV